jgi:putative oxidoreductase
MPFAFQNQTALVGRILLGLFFVMSGFEKITGFSGTVGYISSGGLPMPSVVAALTILVELGGGLMIVFGFYARWAAYALAIFSLLAGFLFHGYWAAPEAAKYGQFVNFWKNVTIAGGMLMLAAFGPGSISIDARRKAA